MANLYNINQLLKQLNQDGKIVFTHGIFDLFHIGHLTFLKESSKLCSKFVVGIDSDKMVSLTKNKKPIYNEKIRMKIISQLSFVDYVVFLDNQNNSFSDYFTKLYHYLNPSIITHGVSTTLYYKEKIMQNCSKLGIEARSIAHPYKDVSTTYYINKIKNNY